MANSDDYTQPIVTTPLGLQTLRASAALPAAGAWTTPLEIFAPTFDSLCLLFAYTRRGAAGAFDWKMERGMAAGEFRPCDAKTAARLLFAPLVQSAIWKHSLQPWDDTGDVTAYLELHLDIFFNGIATGVAKK